MVKDIKEIGLRFGVADEAYKYYTGVLYDSSHRQVKNFPEALWPHFPERNLVPGGRELFDCHEISLLTARNDWAAFQVGNGGGPFPAVPHPGACPFVQTGGSYHPPGQLV